MSRSGLLCRLWSLHNPDTFYYCFFLCTCSYWWLSSFALLVAQRSVVVERDLSCTWWRGIWEKHSLLCNERQSEIVSTRSEQSLKTPMMRRDEEINALLRPITENNFCSHFVAYRRNNFFSRLSKISAVILIHRLKLGGNHLASLLSHTFTDDICS